MMKVEQEDQQRNQQMKETLKAGRQLSLTDHTDLQDPDDVRQYYEMTNQRLKQMKRQNNKIYTGINRKAGEYLKLTDFFTHCLKFYENFLYKSQQIA